MNAVRERRIDWQNDLMLCQFMDLALMEKLYIFYLTVRVTMQIVVFNCDYVYVSVTFLCVAEQREGLQYRNMDWNL